MAVPSLLPFFAHLLEFPLEEAAVEKEVTGEVVGTVVEVEPSSLTADPATAILKPNSTGSAALERLRLLRENKGK